MLFRHSLLDREILNKIASMLFHIFDSDVAFFASEP